MYIHNIIISYIVLQNYNFFFYSFQFFFLEDIVPESNQISDSKNCFPGYPILYSFQISLIRYLVILRSGASALKIITFKSSISDTHRF